MSPRSLSHSWLNGLTATVAMSLLLAGALGLQLLEDRLVSDAGETLVLVAEQVAHRLEEALAARSEEIQFLARMAPHHVGDLESLSAHLTLAKQLLSTYQWLGIIDGQGRVVAATDDTTAGLDVSHEKWFGGLTMQRGVQVLDVQPDELVHGLESVRFALPLAFEDGQSGAGGQGVMVTRIGIPSLEELVTQTLRPLQLKSDYRGSIEYQVLRRQGEVFIDSAFVHKGNTNLLPMHVPSVERALSEESGFVEEVHGRRHVPVITGYARLPETAGSSGLGWIVLVRVDRDAALGPIHATVSKAGMWGAIVVFPMLLTLVWVTRRLQREQRTGEATLKFVESTLDSLTAHVAILDEQGIILSVNQAWRRFAGENGLDDPTCGLGRNYLEVCDTAAGAWSEEAATVGEAIRAILRGEPISGAIDYPCHRPDVKRWYRLSLSRFQIANDVRVVVSHQDVTELVERDRRQAAEHAITKLLVESDSLDRIASDVLRTICHTLDWSLGIMWKLDQSTDCLRVNGVWAEHPDQYGAFIDRTQQSTFSRGVGLPGRVWKSQQVEWITDVTRDTNFPRAPYAVTVGLRAACGFPILMKGELYGIMEFFTRSLREPDEALLNMFGSIAGQLSQYMARKHGEEELKARVFQQAAIAELGRQALAATDLSLFLNQAVILIAGTLTVKFCKILELAPDGGSLMLRTGVGWKEGLVGHVSVSADPDSQAGYTLRVGKSVIVEDLGTETRFSGPPLLHDHHIVSGMSVVIKSHTRPYGVLGIHTNHRRVFSEDDVRFLEAAAGILGMALERSQAKTELRLQKEQAEASAREKAQILAGVQAFFISVAGDGTVNEWTSRAESIFGITASMAIGRHFESLPVEWSWPAIGEAMRKVTATGTVVRLEGVRLAVPGREEQYLELTLSPLYANGGLDYLFMGEDVTERMNLERELAQAQKLESIGQLAAGIAHEINTPTQFVGDNTRFLNDSFAQLREMVGRYRALLAALRNGRVADETLRGLEEAEKAVDLDYVLEEVPKAIAQSIEGIDRIARIVRAMKEFAHPDKGEKTVVGLNKAIESTITVARNEWKYVADMVTDFDPALPPVPCLPGEINQVILNLIVNAAHAIGDVVKEGGGKGTITVSTRLAGEWAEIRIRDTGTGIPEGIRERIFDPFFTTKEVGKGTGQGLAIARTVVTEKHGGSLTFESTVGTGTTFIIRLPVHANAVDERREGAAPGSTSVPR